MIKRSQYRKMPWKNGLGVTEEIDRVPDQELYQWRLSCARISANSEFSSFPGFDRWLIVIEGAGVFLNDVRLEPFQPLRFKGEEPIHCRLAAGEVIDLGLIFDREKIQAEMIFFTNGLSEYDKRAHTQYIFDLDSGNTHKNESIALNSVTKGVLVSIFLKGQ